MSYGYDAFDEDDLAAVLDRYPSAAPFADLIVGESPEDFEEMASAHPRAADN